MSNTTLTQSPTYRKTQAYRGSEPTDTGLGTSDYLGYGMQLAGALMQQSEQEKERKSQEEEARRQEAMTERWKQKDYLANKQDQAQTNIFGQQDRAMQGLNYLTGFNEGAQKLGRQISFRDAAFGRV